MSGSTSQRTRVRLHAISALSLAIAMVAGAASPASADHPTSRVTPTVVGGNPTCSDHVSDPDVVELKFDQAEIFDGAQKTLEGVTVTIVDVHDDGDGPLFDWSATSKILVVVAKGGQQGANVYDYQGLGGTTDDVDLHSPENPNGKWAGLSHISFCFVPVPSTALSLDSSNPDPLVIHEGDNVTLTFAEENDGTQPLTSPSVTADNGCTPAGVTAGGFNVGDVNTNNILDVGETWLFACTVTNIAADVTITAIGHGIDPDGEDVTWCNDVNNPPADTFCDQDERTQVTVDVIHPETELTLNASNPDPLVIHAGDSVTVTVAEENTGDVPLTSPSVSFDPACSVGPTVTGGDTNTNGILDVGETWLFECTINNITVDTTITAIGSGVDPLNFTVTWCQDPNDPPAQTVCSQGEIEEIPVDVIEPSTDLTLDSSSPGLNVPIGTDVTLTFAEENDEDAPLTNAHVTANNGCTPTGILSGGFNVGDTNTDNILSPGETWLFECTITNVVADTTITAIGHGTDELGFDVTWCADPNNPPANTICDEDEIEVVQITVFQPGEGCTPGYWRNHLDSWSATGFSPGQTLESVFDVPNSFGLDDETLLAALAFQGGKGKAGAARILLRAAVAAILNASHPDVDYPRDLGDILTDVNAALTGSRGDMLSLAADLDADNNLGCDIG